MDKHTASEIHPFDAEVVRVERSLHVPRIPRPNLQEGLKHLGPDDNPDSITIGLGLMTLFDK